MPDTACVSPKGELIVESVIPDGVNWSMTAGVVGEIYGGTGSVLIWLGTGTMGIGIEGIVSAALASRRGRNRFRPPLRLASKDKNWCRYSVGCKSRVFVSMGSTH